MEFVFFCSYVEGDEMNRTCSTYGEKRIVYRLLAGKSE
jgi:hypothetical protein